MKWYLMHRSGLSLTEKDKQFLPEFKTGSCFVDYITERIRKDWFLRNDKITLIDILKELEYES